MTRLDLSDWLRDKGCEVDTAHDRDTRVLVFKNPRNGYRAFLASPIDETPVKDFTVCAICTKLMVQIPDFARYCTELHEHIARTHINR